MIEFGGLKMDSLVTEFGGEKMDSEVTELGGEKIDELGGLKMTLSVESDESKSAAIFPLLGKARGEVFLGR